MTRNGGENVSYCRACGAEIDWIQTPEGKYIPVDPEPVFVVEGDGAELFCDEEIGELRGRQARPEEVQTVEEKARNPVAFVPHWRTCKRNRRN